MKIGIIGTAGRKEDGKRLTKDSFNKMVKDAKDRIKIWRFEKNKIDLVSGGAPWADHVAVSLYLSGDADTLTLFLPCMFDRTHKKFFPEGEGKPASIINYYHEKFGKAVGGSSRDGLVKAEKKGAILIELDGFMQRNIKVGEVDVLLAYTFGFGIPSSSGTKHCWDNSPAAKKIHVGISTL